MIIPAEECNKSKKFAYTQVNRRFINISSVLCGFSVCLFYN